MIDIFNFDKLVGRIIEIYKTRSTFAEAMGMGANSLSDRLTGKIPFKTEEIYMAMELLDIPPSELYLYFFTPKVR